MSVDKLTSFRAKVEESKNVKEAKRKNVKTLKRKSTKTPETEELKEQKTLHLPLDVVEYLAVGKARGRGSMSDQVTQLVRAAMKPAKNE